MSFYPTETFTFNPLKKWEFEIRDQIENPYSYKLRQLTKYNKSAFFITNIFFNMLYLILIPFTFLLETAHSIKEPHPFSWRLTALKSLEKISTWTAYIGIFAIAIYGFKNYAFQDFVTLMEKINKNKCSFF